MSIVNNAGVIQTGPLVDFAERDWDRIFAVNVKGIFLMSQAALPHLKKEGGVNHQHRLGRRQARVCPDGRLLRLEIRGDRLNPVDGG